MSYTARLRIIQLVALLLILFFAHSMKGLLRGWKSKVQHSLITNAYEGNLTGMRLCLLLGASTNGTDGGAGPALVSAALAGRVDSMQFLLSHGSDINLQNKYGQTPLMQACHSGHPEAVRFLLDSGADANVVSQGFEPGATALSAAGDNHEIADLLLKRGARAELAKQKQPAK